jgi:TonB family protein
LYVDRFIVVMATSILEINIMRKVILATLALSPIMLHAQANSPAQPQAANAPVLQSKLVQPNEFAAGAAHSATATSGPLRVSTGVAAPKLIHTVDILSDNEWTPRVAGINRKVVVAMLVDAKGVPSDLKIIRSAGGAEMDKNVLAAVSQYRFKPGTLNHEPTPVPLNLEIVMLSSLR